MAGGGLRYDTSTGGRGKTEHKDEKERHRDTMETEGRGDTEQSFHTSVVEHLNIEHAATSAV